jgi:branched-chain amino acid transport system substrate-binding protein
MRRTVLKSLAMFALPGMASGQAVKAGSIDLHHIGPLTGPLAGVNAEAVSGAEMYFSLLNTRGGIGGRKINLIKIDDKQDAQETVRIFKELAASNSILSFFMPRTTPSIYAALPVAQELKIPMFGMQTGGIQITEPIKRYAFTLRASYRDEVIYLIRQLHGTGTKKFALLVDDGVYGKDVIVGAEQALNELKIKPVATASINANKPEAAVPVDKILPAQPEVVILIAGAKGAADFINLYKQKGGLAQFGTLSNNGADSFIKSLGENKRGVIITQALPSPFRKTRQVTRDYAQLVDSSKANIGFGHFYGYLCARVMAEALKRSGRDITPERLTQTIEGISLLDLGGIEISFSPTKRMATNLVEASIVGFDGKLVN